MSALAAFEALQFAPTYRRVATAIAARIRDHSLTEGALLPTETALAAQFGVNRSTVREALRALESEGLLTRRRGTKRLVVSRPSAGLLASRLGGALALQSVTVAEVWETLLLLEPPIAEVAARRRTAQHLQKLGAAAAAFAQVARAAESTATGATSSPAAGVDQVVEFFRAVGAATGNRALEIAHEPALGLLRNALALMIDRVPQARGRIVTAQRRLQEAITARDADGARDWMLRHVRDFRRGFELAQVEMSSPVDTKAANQL